MGTRSLTFVYDESNQPIINMYRQYDGYPEGHGSELAKFLKDGTLVNGVRLGETGRFYNGMGCLAAQLVSNFKNGAGGFYVYSVNAKDCGQDYEYHIFYDDGTLKIKVFNCGMNMFGLTMSDKHELIFEGDLKSFESFCNPVQEFELNDDSVNQLKDGLHKGVVEVTFEKNDGSTRIMKCTLKEDLLPKVETSGKTKQHNADVLPVWDIEANGWRSFRYDSIQTVKVL